MIRVLRFGVCTLWLAGSLFGLIPALDAETPEEAFANPSAVAHAGVWWHWMGGQVTERGIVRDLDWFERTGITSATVFGMADSCTPWAKRIANIPTDGLRPFDERWWKLFAFACREGRKRGIDIGLHNCPGYTSTGGPWIPSRLAMRTLVFDVTNAVEQVSLEPEALFPVFNEETKRYEKPPCAVRRTDIVEIGIARGGVRVAHIPMGAFVQPADWASFGLECDKMNPEAVDCHLDHVIGELKRHLGPNLPTAGLGHILLDSYEAGTPSWTPRMREEFAQRRGYDPLEFLPIIGGRTNHYTTAEVKKFKADFDRTLKDLYRDVLFKRMHERLKAEGVAFANEPYGGPFETEEVAPYVDRIMTEFWYASNTTRIASCNYAKLTGPDGRRFRIVEAEAFTGWPSNCEWTETPANLKPCTDAAFLAGINRLVLHTCPLQPWDDAVRPGVTMGRWGTHFGRTQTWAECGKAWFDYIARCQALLQWGEPCDRKLALPPEAQCDQVARTDGKRTIYFLVPRNTVSWMDGGVRNGRWYDPVTGRITRFDSSLRKGVTGFCEPDADAPVEELCDQMLPMPAILFEPPPGDCAASANAEVRYFSGTRTYRAKFDVPPCVRCALVFSDPADQVYVVRVNGRVAGTAWCAPWTVELPVEALKEKGNELEIDVTNGWRNRLIGDEREPADCVFEEAPMTGGRVLTAYPDWFKEGLSVRPSKGRRCFVTWNYFNRDSKLMPSGLLSAPTLMWREKR